MMTWFITVLINVSLMNVVPGEGWVQGQIPFQNKELCEEMIPVTAPSIFMSVNQMTSGLGEIKDIVCMTEQEWIDKNVELGHDVPADLKMKTQPKGT
jgi:hypothetical protein